MRFFSSLNKLVFSILILIFLLIPMCSLAESVEEVSITFRGIPWGSSYNDIQNSLLDGEHLGKLSRSHHCSTANSYVTGTNEILYSGEELGAFCSLFSADGHYVPVAGYETVVSELEFVYMPNENGLIDYNQKNTALIKAMYSIETIVPNVVFEGLLKKLTSVYGEPVYEKRYSDSCPVWSEKDGSMVGLIILNDNHVIIRYTFNGADALITETHNNLVETEMQKIKDTQSDISGLE